MGSYVTRMAADLSNESISGSSEYDSEQDSEDFQQDYEQILDSVLFGGDVLIRDITHDEYGRPIVNLKIPPNTSTLDKSEFSLITKQSSGVAEPKRKVPKLDSNNVTDILNNRERGLYTNQNLSHAKRCKVSNRFLPNEIHFFDTSVGKLFCGIFSKDGTNFLTASQDRTIRIYNSGDGSYKLMKSLRARDVGWSIIDVAFSPDRQHFVYSTWSCALHLCSVSGSSEHQEPLRLMDTSRRFCIFSVVFSSDGKELLGGANDGCLYIYNRECNRQTLRIPAHEYDVNSVVFADQSSQIIYSGGDDGLVRVWDRRTMDESHPKHVGFLAGHMDGITFVDSRGDGRHLISNSKDQSIKLWDVRVFSSDRAAENSLRMVQSQTWDYRWQEVPKKCFFSKKTVNGDTSVMTYRGHVVIKTLVRCRFSPVETTGQRYIYTGCGMGRVVVYDALTGQIVDNLSGHTACVRDVDWHPYRHEILSSAWDGMVGKWSYFDPSESIKFDPYCNALIRRSKRLANMRKSR